MRVEWEEMAESNRDLIGDYIFDSFGYDALEHFYEEVNQTVNLLMRHFFPFNSHTASAISRSNFLRAIFSFHLRIDSSWVMVFPAATLASA